MELLPWLITAFTVVTVFFLDKWENKYLKSLFDWVPAILLAYLIPALISASMGVNFAASSIHAYSKSFFIPLAIVAVMSSLSLTQLRSIGWKPLVIFVSGSFWIALFPVAIGYLFYESQLVQQLFMNQSYWKGLPPIVGSWIGGSTSQLVLKELVNCPEEIFLAILVFDNILVNIWTILMFQGIKRSGKLNSWLAITDLNMPEEISSQKGRLMSPLLCIGVLLLIVFLSHLWIPSFILKIVLLSFIGLLLSNLIKTWNLTFVLKLGSVLILTVMAILGLKLNFSQFHLELGLLSFLVIWLISHFLLMLVVAKLLNANSAWVPIASMANVGGIATAPAVTAAYEEKWMPHAILLAILSMATGTFWGMVTIYLLEKIVG